MRQVVRFAESPAGRVAYSVMGSGPPLVCMFGWVSHLGLLWENAEHRRFVEALAREHTVIRYDKLGCGLSDRARTEFTMESELAVLEALVGQLGPRPRPCPRRRPAVRAGSGPGALGARLAGARRHLVPRGVRRADRDVRPVTARRGHRR